MATTKLPCKVVKKSQRKGATKQAPKGFKAASFEIQDNEDCSFTVFGVDAAGSGGIDISAVATLAAVSADTTVLTVDPATGATVPTHGVKPGTVSIGVDATWTDGSVGPFHTDVDGTVKQGPVAGLEVTFGPNVPRP